MTTDETVPPPDDATTPEAGPGIDIWDSTGKLVGEFYKTGLAYRPDGYILDGEWLSDEEMDRRMNEGRWYSVAEVDAFMEELKRAHPPASR